MQIHEHAHDGDMQGLARELAAGVAVDVRHPQTDLTPLAEAASSPHAGPEVLHFLIEHGAEVNAVCGARRGKSVLFWALTSWDPARLELLLDAGADIEYRTEGGYDVLTSCFFREGARDDPRLLETLSLLIERGAALGRESDYGESALSIASRLGRWDVCQRLLDAGDDPAPLGWTELHRRVALGTLAQVEAAVTAHAELEVSDSWDRTPWLLSLARGDLRKAECLTRAGARHDARGRCRKHPYLYAIEGGHLHVLEWLIAAGFEVDEVDDFQRSALTVAASEGEAAMVEALLSAGADPEHKDSSDASPMKQASSVEIMRLLAAAGADAADISDELRQQLTGLEKQTLDCSAEAFEHGHARRFGERNPEAMDVVFWRAMVRARSHAWAARQIFSADPPLPARPRPTPVWCYARYGQSITELGDGRVVEVGGEHEDHYDPDFCIYNDVVVHDGQGGFEIYGYPRDTFPPTDFHSATLFEAWIYLVGSLGYPEHRDVGRAQVYRLCTQDFHIERVETRGDDPGWLSAHRARLLAPAQLHISGGKVCSKDDYVPNDVEWVLDLRTHVWRRARDG